MQGENHQLGIGLRTAIDPLPDFIFPKANRPRAKFPRRGKGTVLEPVIEPRPAHSS